MDRPRAERQKKGSPLGHTEGLIVRGIPDHLVTEVHSSSHRTKWHAALKYCNCCLNRGLGPLEPRSSGFTAMGFVSFRVS